MPNETGNGKIRYAVVGLGHIAQAAILPAFQNAANAEVAALVSGDADKMSELAARYNVSNTFSYERFQECLSNGIDAVYIALPNDMHRDFAVNAAHSGVHVLCEKPLALTQEQCADVITACSDNNVKLMVAYRLHFEPANLEAIEIVRSGRIGEPRLFTATFAMQVRPGNIRVQAQHGGGSVYDIGIYCINAARYIFGDEPLEVFAWEGTNGDSRFEQVDEMMSVILRFPRERLATFTCSFNGPSIQEFTVMGSKGALRVDPAFDYALELKHRLTTDSGTEERTFPKRDQFAAQLTYFSDCILQDRTPEPDGWEGLQDVQIIEAIYQSAKSSLPVKLRGFPRERQKADGSQAFDLPPVDEPELVKVEAPTLNG
jgi:glucose-fructose oxidoreductase